ncbi:MAG: hypothetical protein ABIH20_06530 [Candidatus Diapherotrites archaeon]
MNWKIGILVLGILVIVFIIGCVETSTPATLTATPVFESSVTVSSGDDVKTIFNENSEEIITKTIEFVGTASSDEFGRYKQLLETKSSLFQYLTVEYKAWSNEKFWISNTNENYVVKIPLVSEDENWSYENGKVVVMIKTCNNPAENMSTNMETGEEHCGSGIKETKKEVQNLRYIVTNNGIVHFAGIY